MNLYFDHAIYVAQPKEYLMELSENPDRHKTMPYPLRLPPEVRAQLTAEAVKGRRSLNGEILFRLENSLKQLQGVLQ